MIFANQFENLSYQNINVYITLMDIMGNRFGQKSNLQCVNVKIVTSKIGLFRRKAKSAWAAYKRCIFCIHIRETYCVCKARVPIEHPIK